HTQCSQRHIIPFQLDSWEVNFMRSNERRRAFGIFSLLPVVFLVLIASSTATSGPATVKYVIDTAQSKFMARAFAGGLLWFKGHDHHLVAKDFSGEVELTPDSIT